MTDEEKAEEYVKEQILKHNRDVVLRPKNAVTYIDELKQAYLDGFAEGKNEGYEQGKMECALIIQEKDFYIKRYLKEIGVHLNKKTELEEINEQLKKEISILLSCSNCPENKGGYICEKEYNDKCLSQKIEYIKELKEEIENYQLAENESKEIIAELKTQIEKMKNVGNCKHTMQCPDWVEHHIKGDNIKSCLNCIKWELAE